jgi:hypothetical protein
MNQPPHPGFNIYLRKGCAACHSVDGSPGVGPTLRNLYGSERLLTDGTTVIADADYLIESIIDPGAKIVEGYTNQMQAVPFTERELAIIVHWMASISRYELDEELPPIPERGTTSSPGLFSGWFGGGDDGGAAGTWLVGVALLLVIAGVAAAAMLRRGKGMDTKMTGGNGSGSQSTPAQNAPTDADTDSDSGQ